MSDLIPWAETRCSIELGRGVAGTVFLFRHAVSKIPVAAKLVEYPGECFRNEVRIHQAISGLPWFPTFYGSFDIADDQTVLAMEFVGNKSEDQGLKALHSNGFLCNDLKEDNVLVVEESGLWQTKIINLGWASEIATPFVMPLDEEQIDFYRSCRGCCHIAPECVLDARPCSTSSDVYSLGRLLASIGRAMRYDDFEFSSTQIYLADEEQRPTVQEIIDQLYKMRLAAEGEDGPGSSSC
ncbi:uncharacterized protein LOC115928564 [Strongylocentrotus purpuratus]|uniref:Protein kinase domain-containing protein n=1 Tax=Strongylocentrotus purpuratus TaxID=7668 RepID=A0A7M7PIM4_STRPU|nr:uncharacterized protein LOC115928564 [Strongylocentrotus purpuratus]